MATTVIALIATAVVHYLYGGIRLQVSRDRLSGAAQVQISVLLGVFVLAKGVDYYLDRFDLVNESNRLFTGMNYTADNAVLPAKNILLGIALICAVLFFLNIWRRTWQLPVVGLALLAVSSVLLGMIWPAIVQQFQVKPSEADKEAPYIQDNIEATRAAYDLSDVEYASYQATPSGDPGTTALIEQTSAAPVIDPKLVRQTFEELQQGRAYYSVANVLDVDRYELARARDAAGARRPRARHQRGGRRRPELVQPAHRLHPRRRRDRRLREPHPFGRRGQRDRVGRGDRVRAE